jgi:carboxyl-terminal processing protease
VTEKVHLGQSTRSLTAPAYGAARMSAGSRPAPSAALAMRKQRNRPTRGAAVAALLTALLVPAVPVLATISFTDGQRQTAAELVEQLEDRHYSKRRYDDELASEHLDNFIDSLDGGRMFFTAADIADFEVYRTKIDDDLRAGRLDAGLEIFNLYHERLLARLRDLLDTLPERIAALDFTLDERYELDAESRPWAADAAELDERWRLQLKNQVLNLRLADKPEDEIIETLSRRYRNQLGRVEQYNGQDAFQIFANALTELYDPHTNYFSPRRSENFNISMRLSLEGIGAVLSSGGRIHAVARIVPAGPADKQGQLQPSDRIVAVAQGDDGEFEDVIGWRLDEVVSSSAGRRVRRCACRCCRPRPEPMPSAEEIRIVRNEVKLEEQSAQKRIIEVPRGDGGTAARRRDRHPDLLHRLRGHASRRRGVQEHDPRRAPPAGRAREEGIDGLIIDLRNNGGGSLQEANELTGLFIEYGPTVQIRHSSRRVWRDGKRLRSSYYDGPLAGADQSPVRVRLGDLRRRDPGLQARSDRR